MSNRTWALMSFSPTGISSLELYSLGYMWWVKMHMGSLFSLFTSNYSTHWGKMFQFNVH